jgi:hypothetical protein
MSSNPIIEAIKKSACAHLNQHLVQECDAKKRKPKFKKRPSKEVQWMHWQLFGWCTEKKLILTVELQFHDFRKYRFDFTITDHEDHKLAKLKIGIEYHGVNSEKSGHTTITGFTKDQDKARLAQSEGWKVLAFTVLDYNTVLQEVEKQML